MNTDDSINPNIHIDNYLYNYLTLNNPEYAILLNGKWGSGKTYFIKNFIINNEKKNDKIKFIKISLFGLNNTNAIDEEIFQNLHPLLCSKYAKITGNILKGALKLGVNLDWNNDNQKDGTANIDLKEFNPLDFFSDKKKSKQEIIFIFDDLERTEIKLKEILGYINYLVEQSNFKVIILANEEKIDKVEYKEFKEKIIGKTFQVKHYFNDILNSFISKKTTKAKGILLENIINIKDIYKKANYNNLRHVSQILFDFEYFINKIDKCYINNKAFISILINNFFALSIELKSANLNRDELLKRNVITFDFSEKEKEKTNIEKIYEKYNIKTNPLFNGSIWVQILLENSIKDEELNTLISNLTFFLKQKENQQPSWVKLWHYRQLDDEEFIKTINDVIIQFKNCQYHIPEHFLHVVALLIFFSKKSLCKLSIEEINENINICIEKQYKNSPTWKNKLFKDSMRFNNTGLGYMNEEDEDFRKIFSKILEENKSIYKVEEKIKQQNSLEDFLKSIKILDENFILKYLQDNASIPIFHNLNSNEFINVLIGLKNKNISKLGEILHSRYSDNNYLNGKLYYCYLTVELDFWKEVKKYLDKYLQNVNSKKLQTLLLNEFNIYVVDGISKKLESCLKT